MIRRWVMGGYPYLALIILAASILRLWGVGFGLPNTNCRPDEGTLIGASLGFFGGDFNPHFFNYPSLHLYVLYGVFQGVCFLKGKTFLGLDSPIVTDPVNLYLSARMVSVILGVASVIVVYKISRQLMGRLTAIIASLFLAVSCLHVRDSHFATTDVPVTFGVLVAFLLLIRARNQDGLSGWFLAGAAAGLAMGVKYCAIFIVFPACFAMFSGAACSMKSQNSSVGPDLSGRRCPRMREAWKFLLKVAAPGSSFMVSMLGAFVLATPYAVLDFRTFIRDFQFETSHLLAGHGLDVGRGWWSHFRYSFPYGLGVLVFWCALWGACSGVIRRRPNVLFVLLFPLALYVVMGRGQTVFVRYMVPALPFLCVLAGGVVAEWGLCLSRRFKLPVRWPTVLLAGCISLDSIVAAVSMDRCFSKRDTRVLAAEWFEQAGVQGSTVFQWGTPLSHVMISGVQPFTENGPPADYIFILESPLTMYNPPPSPSLQWGLLNHYRKLAEFTGVESLSEGWYDQSDAFYLPLRGLSNVSRPGPNIAIHVRKHLPSQNP